MVTPPGGWGLSRFMSQDGAWPSGKAPVFGTGIRRFESFRPSHYRRLGMLVADLAGRPLGVDCRYLTRQDADTGNEIFWRPARVEILRTLRRTARSAREGEEFGFASPKFVGLTRFSG